MHRGSLSAAMTATNSGVVFVDIKTQAEAFLPVSGWKQWVGLFVVVVLIIAAARKFGVQQKINKAVGVSA
jgi:hypothetical protein